MKKIEQELRQMAFAQDPDFDKLLEKRINRKIRKIAFKSAAAVVLAVMLIFLGISPLMNLYYTNPAKLNEGNPSKLLSVMRAYYETMYPYREVCGIEVEKDGFGRYTLALDLIDHSEGKIAVGDYDVTMSMKRGKLAVESDRYKRTANRIVFFDEDAGEDLRTTKADVEALAGDMKMLPRSSYLYLSVSDKKPRKIGTLMKKNSDAFQVHWAQIDQPDCDFQAGMSLDVSTAAEKTDYREDLTEEQLKTVYLKNLTLLKDNMEIWKGLDMPSNNSVYMADKELLEESIEKARQSERFETKNYCVSGSRDAIIAFLKAGNFDSVSVDHIEYSML